MAEMTILPINSMYHITMREPSLQDGIPEEELTGLLLKY
jgi:hypothetical protein